MKKADNKKIYRKEVSEWVEVLSYLLVIISIFLNFILYITQEPVKSLFVGLFVVIWTLFIGIITIICGYKCSRWAVKIKRNPNIAYVIGFLFGLLGLLVYYVYYESSINK